MSLERISCDYYWCAVQLSLRVRRLCDSRARGVMQVRRKLLRGPA